MKTDFALTGIAELQLVLHGFMTRALGLHLTAFPLIVEDFWRMEAERFDSHGPGWAPLSPATVEIKTAAGYDEPSTPMVATGALRASLTGETEHTVIEVHPESLFVGTDLEYAKYHQTGPRNIRVFGGPAAVLPERRLVEVSLEDAARWAGIIQAALGRVGRAA